jgi:hypothetical protein
MTLHFVVAESHRSRLRTQQWSSEWPPPAKLFLIKGRIVGIEAMITQEQLDRLRPNYPDLDEIYEVTELIKVSQSQIPEGSELSFVAPSARYVPPDEVEERWWE